MLFTILLAAVTAGAGLAASAASQALHFAKFRKVGQLLMEFGEQVKKARRLRKSSAKGNQKASFEDFESLGEVEVSKPADTGPRTRRGKPKPNGAEPKSTAEAGDVPNSKLLTGQVEYGSTDLSKIAIDYARTEKINGARNIAVFEYTDLDGSVKTIAKASKRGKGHAEKLIAEELKKLGIPNDNVTRIYSELARILHHSPDVPVFYAV